MPLIDPVPSQRGQRTPLHIGDIGRPERAPLHVDDPDRERAPRHFGDIVRPEGAPPLEDDPAHVDARIAALAARQHGIVTLGQLRALGLSARAVQYRARRGSLHRLHRGTYAVGHRAVTASGHRLAAVLASGPDALLSHGSGAAAWRLRFSASRIHDVTVAGHRRGPAGVRLHCTRRLTAADVAVVDGIPVTSVARTLVDLAGILDATRLERAVHEAEILDLLDVAVLEPMLDAARGRRGTRVLREILATTSPGVTRSELEIRFLELCRRHALTPPVCNARVEGYEVDALWAPERVVVELDGARVHGTRRAFHADRRRDAALAAAGYVVVRLTWERVTREQVLVARQLQQILATRRAAARVGDA